MVFGIKKNRGAGGAAKRPARPAAEEEKQVEEKQVEIVNMAAAVRYMADFEDREEEMSLAERVVAWRAMDTALRGPLEAELDGAEPDHEALLRANLQALTRRSAGVRKRVVQQAVDRLAQCLEATWHERATPESTFKAKALAALQVLFDLGKTQPLVDELERGIKERCAQLPSQPVKFCEEASALLSEVLTSAASVDHWATGDAGGGWPINLRKAAMTWVDAGLLDRLEAMTPVEDPATELHLIAWTEETLAPPGEEDSHCGSSHASAAASEAAAALQLRATAWCTRRMTRYALNRLRHLRRYADQLIEDRVTAGGQAEEMQLATDMFSFLHCEWHSVFLKVGRGLQGEFADQAVLPLVRYLGAKTVERGAVLVDGREDLQTWCRIAQELQRMQACVEKDFWKIYATLGERKDALCAGLDDALIALCDHAAAAVMTTSDLPAKLYTPEWQANKSDVAKGLCATVDRVSGTARQLLFSEDAHAGAESILSARDSDLVYALFLCAVMEAIIHEYEGRLLLGNPVPIRLSHKQRPGFATRLRDDAVALEGYFVGMAEPMRFAVPPREESFKERFLVLYSLADVLSTRVPRENRDNIPALAKELKLGELHKQYGADTAGVVRILLQLHGSKKLKGAEVIALADEAAGPSGAQEQPRPYGRELRHISLAAVHGTTSAPRCLPSCCGDGGSGGGMAGNGSSDEQPQRTSEMPAKAEEEAPATKGAAGQPAEAA